LRDMPGPRSLANRPALVAATLAGVVIASALVVSGCTSIRERMKNLPTKPELAARMRLIDRLGVALGRAIDDGDLGGVDDAVKGLVVELQSVRPIQPAPLVEGEEVDMYSYYSALDASVKYLGDIRYALGSNRWDLIGERYERLRVTCIACHRSYAAGTVVSAMPQTRNF
jgi:hypothetical protein